MLNERLKCFINSNGLLHEEQTGFRNDYPTIDHIFSLSFIVNIYLSEGKRLYAAFIDYKKAFDSINRVALWKKLVGNGINGLILKVIFNIYGKAKSCVCCGIQQSEYFQSNVGVRQGENLSPLLFALFLDDLVPFLSTKYQGLSGLCSITNDILSDDTIDVYLRLFISLYADDTVVLAENKEQLQVTIDAMKDFCELNSLQINVNKTKIIVFLKVR